MVSSSSAADHHHHHHRRRRDVPPDNQRHRDPSAGHSNHSHHGHGHGHVNGSGGMSGSEHSRRSSNRNRSDRGHATSPTTIAFRECLASLNLPPGLLSSILTKHRSCDSRLWLLDNSSLMKVRDSHVGRCLNKFGAGNNNEIIERVDGVTRWEELRDAVEFHAGMAARCRMPTRYWLVNPDEGAEAAGARNGYKFGVCWGSSEEPNNDNDGDDDNNTTAADDETRNVRRIMDNVTLNRHSACPLASRVRSLAKGIARESPALEARNNHVAVVICTQGLPTDDAGATNSSVQKEFVHELAELSKLPARVIVRLCTDDECVRDVFNAMDGRFDSFDVLDDFWGEAMEVYLHNPWLTYGMGLHRLREAGLAPEVLDDIDEHPLTLDEIHQLCKMLFLGEDDGCDNVDRQLPHPARHWNGFFKSLRTLVEKEKPQWNPIRKSTMPWINLQKLESIHIREHRGKHRGSGCGGGGGGGEQNRQQQQQQQQSSSHQHQHRRTSHQSHESREETKSQRSSQASHPSHHSGRHETRQHHHQPPHTNARQHQQQQQQHHEKRKPTSSGPTSSTTPPEDLTLTEVLQRWSHEPPRYNESMRPLQDLLVTVPRTLFPPNNTKVEGHEYFAKWKAFDEEAFADESGDELKELLKRAVRKAKFFLHPDKLPKDLTEDQTLLFKTVWNVIAEQESETLG